MPAYFLFALAMNSAYSYADSPSHQDKQQEVKSAFILTPVSTLPLFLKYNDESLDEVQLSSFSLENKINFRLKQENLRLCFEVNNIASKRLGSTIDLELRKLGVLVKDHKEIDS
ncbi:MAG: hypothetical protein GY694_09960 [Gammaproteobacteria bacterium]|nr:hypothetical protein [Gammaproteobacteria bacterium]